MTDPALHDAFKMHQDSEYEKAAAVCEDFIRSNPEHPVATTLLRLARKRMAIARQSMMGALINLKLQGFLPGTVIDVGAQFGTAPLYDIFPESHHVMLETVAECEPALQELCRQLASAEYHIAAASDRSESVSLWVSQSKEYSSITDLEFLSKHDIRTIDAITLDDLCGANCYTGPFLVKIDVDGAEINVLKGATTLFRKDSVFVIEATLNDERPRFPRILEFLKDHDFVLHDIIDPMYRPVDKALWQVDVVMVHADSTYRSIKLYQ